MEQRLQQLAAENGKLREELAAKKREEQVKRSSETYHMIKITLLSFLPRARVLNLRPLLCRRLHLKRSSEKMS